MGALLNRRRYMGVQKQEKVLFEMYNQYFNGTVSSVVDTGIKLWDGTHNSWKMKVVYQKLAGQANMTTLFTVRPDSSPYSGIRLRNGSNGNIDFELTLSDSWNIIKNDGGFGTYVQATYGNSLRKDAPLDYDSLTIIRDGNTLFIDYNGYTATIQITDPKTNNLNLLIGCDYKGANNETQRYYTGTVQKFVISELGDYPYDAEIEYLESSGDGYRTGQVINSDVLIPSDCKHVEYHFKFAFTKSQKGVLCGHQTINYNNPRTYLFYSSRTASVKEFYAGNKIANYTIEPLDIVDGYITLDEDTGKFEYYRDGLLVGQHNMSGTALNRDYPIRFFGGSYGNSFDDLASARIWKFSIVHGNVVVRDFIPVRVGQTGYMYDKVSGQLFGNSGTGDFVLGPDIN